LIKCGLEYGFPRLEKKRSTRYWKKEAKFKKYFLERDNGKK